MADDEADATVVQILRKISSKERPLRSFNIRWWNFQKGFISCSAKPQLRNYIFPLGLRRKQTTQFRFQTFILSPIRIWCVYRPLRPTSAIPHPYSKYEIWAIEKYALRFTLYGVVWSFFSLFDFYLSPFTFHFSLDWDWKFESVTNQLTDMRARDTCVSKNGEQSLSNN